MENGQCAFLHYCVWFLTGVRGELSSLDRRAYINAVLCLSKKLGKTPSQEFPGVRSRYDDFVAIHINQSLEIHGTAHQPCRDNPDYTDTERKLDKLLSWHRYYVWSYEQALRDECGYNGTQPVSDHFKLDAILSHPLSTKTGLVTLQTHSTLHYSMVQTPAYLATGRL